MTHGEALEALQRKAKAMTAAEREALAERLIEQGAPGDAFERLHRAGWRAKSTQGGDRIGSCGGTLCGVCHPTADILERERRMKRREK